MSMIYDVKEHLVVKNAHEGTNDIPISVMHFQLSLLGALMLTDNAAITSLELTVDGEKHQFSGKEVTPALHTLLRTMDQGNNVDIAVQYWYRWSSNWDYLNVGPLAVVTCVEQLLKEEPELAENIFYSMYNEADCDTGGTMVAYGKKDGKVYQGSVAFVPAALPENGVWENHETTIVFDDDLTDDMDIAAIEQIGHAFVRKFPDSASFIRDKDGVCLTVNDLTLRSKAEFETMIDLYSGLIRATNDKCGMIGEFVDLSGKDAALLTLDIQADGSYDLEISRT